MITTKHLIPTGYLFLGKYDKGQLETLSIGDYGKQYNVKADFLGFNDEIKGVPNTYCMPLSEKWVITVSTQYGCALGLDKVKTRENGCKFCSVPNIKYIDSEIAKIDAMFEKTQNEPANFPSKLNDDGETVYVCQSLRNELFEHIRHRVRQSYVQGFWYGWSLRDGMKDTE